MALHVVVLVSMLGVTVRGFATLSPVHIPITCSDMMWPKASSQRILSPRPILQAKAADHVEDDKKQQKRKDKKSADKETDNNKGDSDAKKQELVKAVGEKMRQGISQREKDASLLDKLNPFKAGQSLRQTIDTALTSINRDEKKSIFYIDDRFSSINDMTSALDRLEQDDDWIPEVLVVGATGEVGQLVVKRLLLDGRFRVRVLVKDLYTKTLNMFGTGVTYCQGDLSNTESLEFALTDVDKIVFCSNPPLPDEEQFQEKFREFMKENLEGRDGASEKLTEEAKSASAEEWEQLESVLQVRAQLAEQVDYVGLRNLIQAFQNVRHSDYGTSQAAKRTLFKFQSRPEDFNLFSLEDGDDGVAQSAGDDTVGSMAGYEDDDETNDKYADYMDDDDDDYEGEFYSSDIEKRRDASVKTQTQWIRNQFGHGVFVGRVPKATDSSDGGEASVTSSRFRSRRDPESGIELGAGFGGFICRVCSDGGKYEAFVRTGSYYDDGIEYVCQFSTATKPTGRNKSKNKFTTVRLPFENFTPVQKKETGKTRQDVGSIPIFQGSDVRNIGFRYRSASNMLKSKREPGEWSNFYLALSYIKLYRTQPEPEFVYLSDAEIPHVVAADMVRAGTKQLVTANSGSEGDGVILNESTLQSATRKDVGRSPEEVYYKYLGEELLKNSGLSYAIARVAGFNEVPASETSTIDLRPTNEEVTAISRAEVAEVCVSALLDSSALNKSFYVTKKKGSVLPTDQAEDMKAKFKALKADVVA